jgi:hypothetical protein
MKTIIALCAIAISGCAGINPNTIKAMEGQSASLCVEFPAWNGSPGKAHFATFGGKSTGTAGGGGEATCGSSTVKFSNEGKSPKVTP